VKVLLCYLCDWKDRRDYYMSLMPYGLISIAAFLEKRGHDVTLANFSRTGFRRAAESAARDAYDVIGLSLFSFNRTDSLAFIRALRPMAPSAKIVLGGPHATFLSDELLRRYPEIDCLITGEGEEAFYEYVESSGRGESPGPVIHGRRISDLDSLPMASGFGGRLEGINVNEQHKILITTRGCPGDCSYCSSPFFWSRRVSFRSARSIVDEMESIHRRYGIIYFSIRDDNFTLKKSRVLEVASLLRERNLYFMWNCQARVDTIDRDMLIAMKRSGLEHIQYGVESGSPRVLERYSKSITPEKIMAAAATTRETGVYLSIYLMNGMEGETMEDVRKTISLVKKILPGDGMVSPVAYYPGTRLYEEMKAAGRVNDDVWFTSGDNGIFLRSDEKAAQGMAMILEELEALRKRSWYREEDFRNHRSVAGEDCWVTDILEGDWHRHGGRLDRALGCYGRVLELHPRNVWGYLRMGKTCMEKGDPEEALKFYGVARDIAPEFYGVYLKRAEILLGMGRRSEAESSAGEALRRNPMDERVRNLAGRLRSK
jgi:radical SAM superfamily enzyme YgiQ (UPF0313 family)